MNKLDFNEKQGKATKNSEELITEKNKKVIKEKNFYEKSWFWICLTIIVVCITKPYQIIICGNNNGNGSSNTGKDV